MYKIRKLIDDGLNIDKLNDKIRDDIETIKYLSKDFKVEEPYALKLDELLEQKIKRDCKEAMPVRLKVIRRKIEQID